MGEEKREEPDDFYTRAYKLLEDWARERGVLDEWKGELEKLARKKGPSSLPVEVLKKLPEREDIEKKATEIMKFLGIPLTKQRLEICGKLKGFDLVNVEQGIVGDVKDFGHKGDSSSAQMEVLKPSAYHWFFRMTHLMRPSLAETGPIGEQKYISELCGC